MKKQTTLLLETHKFRVLEQLESVGDASTEIRRPYIIHPGAVAIIPLLPDDQVCLIQNHRVAVDYETQKTWNVRGRGLAQFSANKPSTQHLASAP